MNLHIHTTPGGGMQSGGKGLNSRYDSMAIAETSLPTITSSRDSLIRKEIYAKRDKQPTLAE
jgi:hypothetical protein